MSRTPPNFRPTANFPHRNPWYSGAMKVNVLYRPDSEHRSMVEEFARNFQSRTGGIYPIELLNADSREGSDLAKLYDVMQYPAILVIDQGGALQQLWEGDSLPLINEVIAYTRT